MRDSNHVHRLMADYALGLLPHSQRQEVERHAAACVDCRRALQQEQQIGRMVRETVQVAAAPASDRLRQLMPATSRRHVVPLLSQPWQKQLAALCVTLILLVSSAGLYSSNQHGWRNSAPSFIAVTATMTSHPTATLARVEATGAVEPTDTTVTSDTIPAVMETAAVATPSPALAPAEPSATATFTQAPTPIAALFALSN